MRNQQIGWTRQKVRNIYCDFWSWFLLDKRTSSPRQKAMMFSTYGFHVKCRIISLSISSLFQGLNNICNSDCMFFHCLWGLFNRLGTICRYSTSWLAVLTWVRLDVFGLYFVTLFGSTKFWVKFISVWTLRVFNIVSIKKIFVFPLFLSIDTLQKFPESLDANFLHISLFKAHN